jgi:hypothetical protein
MWSSRRRSLLDDPPHLLKGYHPAVFIRTLKSLELRKCVIDLLAHRPYLTLVSE